MNSLPLNSDVVSFINLVVKSMVIVSFIVYALFAAILISQVRIKRQTIQTALGPFFETFAYVHLFISIGLIILALIIL